MEQADRQLSLSEPKHHDAPSLAGADLAEVPR